jgi:hypothetical protein
LGQIEIIKMSTRREAGMPAKKKTAKKKAKKAATRKKAARKKTSKKTSTKKAAVKKTTAKKAARPQRSIPKIDLRTYINELNRRAYEIYQQKGSTHGHDWDDWFQAEKEVKRKYGIKE